MLEYESLKSKLKATYEKRINLVNNRINKRSGRGDPYQMVHRLIQQNSIQETKEFDLIDNELYKNLNIKTMKNLPPIQNNAEGFFEKRKSLNLRLDGGHSLKQLKQVSKSGSVKANKFIYSSMIGIRHTDSTDTLDPNYFSNLGEDFAQKKSKYRAA